MRFHFCYKDENIELEWKFVGFGIKPNQAFHEIMDRFQEKLGIKY